MPFDVRCQTVGTRTLSCQRCGRVNRVRVNERSWRFACPNDRCGLITVVGTAWFNVTRDPSPRHPTDLAIPRPSGEPASLIIADRSDPAAYEPTIYGGTWRSGEPITLEYPDPLTDPRSRLWRDRSTGDVYAAVKVAVGTRYVAQPINGTSIDRICVGWREWLERMEPEDQSNQ